MIWSDPDLGRCAKITYHSMRFAMREISVTPRLCVHVRLQCLCFLRSSLVTLVFSPIKVTRRSEETPLASIEATTLRMRQQQRSAWICPRLSHHKYNGHQFLL
ncbi:unnamed protein product [Scytosiphon promiscuus]